MAKAKSGLRGKDSEQESLRDTRQGTYDPVGNQTVPDTSRASPHERAQPGAAMQGEPVPTRGDEIPEGLRRERKGAYGKDTGRGGVPDHVPHTPNKTTR